MVPAKTLVYAFNLQYDRIDSDSKSNLRLEEKLFYINKAIQLYVKSAIKYAEINSELRTSLRNLEKKEVKLKVVDRKSVYDVFEIPKESLRILRQRVLAKREGCGKKEIPIVMVSTDDLNLSRKNPYWKSSFQWEHCLGDEGSDGMYAYHEGDFSIEHLIIDFYEKPKDVHAPSLHENKEYVDWYGNTIKSDVNLEFDINFDYQRIINIAILMAKADSGDINDFNVQLNNILNLEKLNL